MQVVSSILRNIKRRLLGYPVVIGVKTEVGRNGSWTSPTVVDPQWSFVSSFRVSVDKSFVVKYYTKTLPVHFLLPQPV